MKIIQNKIWMRFLLLGVISFTLLNFSCNKTVEYIKYSEYTFINKTESFIKYEQGLEKYNVPPKSSVTIKLITDADEEVSLSNYQAPFFAEYNFNRPILKLFFDNNKCLDVHIEDTAGPLNIENYIAERVNERTFRFTYTFTEEDYSRALDCP